MPVTESTQYAKFNTVGLTQRPDSIEAEGRIRFLNDNITFVGDESSSDTVACLPLPKGAMVDLSQSAFVGPAMSGVTFHLGCNGTTDNLADGVSVDSAGTRIFDADNTGLIEVTDGTLTLTVAGGSPGAVTQRVRVAYFVR